MRLTRAWVIALLLLASVPMAEEAFISHGPTLFGYSVEIINGQVLVRIGVSPAPLLLMVLIQILFWKMPVGSTATAKSAGFLRRVAAFNVDMVLGILFSTSFLGMVPWAWEVFRTREFSLYFERDYLSTFDKYFGTPLIVISMAFFFMYFAYPLVRGKQTIGDYVMQLQVFRADGSPGFSVREALIRTALGFIGLSSWPVTLFRGINKKGQTWYDKAANTHVVRVQNSQVEILPS